MGAALWGGTANETGGGEAHGGQCLSLAGREGRYGLRETGVLSAELGPTLSPSAFHSPVAGSHPGWELTR